MGAGADGGQGGPGWGAGVGPSCGGGRGGLQREGESRLGRAPRGPAAHTWAHVGTGPSVRSRSPGLRALRAGTRPPPPPLQHRSSPQSSGDQGAGTAKPHFQGQGALSCPARGPAPGTGGHEVQVTPTDRPPNKAILHTAVGPGRVQENPGSCSPLANKWSFGALGVEATGEEAGGREEAGAPTGTTQGRGGQRPPCCSSADKARCPSHHSKARTWTRTLTLLPHHCTPVPKHSHSLLKLYPSRSQVPPTPRERGSHL